ncbi:flagellar hook-basal body complex protein [Caenispirillum salinarum]|uniref:flagellar hook-basal body complex protein n=1 Tax=Caenispirillum salinarum TaxID=859058 RepID=UPI00384AAA00
MTVYGAMNAAVSGMKAQSKSLGHISDNIANSQTVGFKRIDTSFAELVTLSNRMGHQPGGVIATPRYRHSIGGDISQTQITTNMGISGNGFFLVSEANSVTPTGVSFDNEEIFSRRGDFQMDKFGYLKNGGNYYLNGRRVLDEDTLNTSDVNEPIRIETDVMQANMTTRVNYNANLPANAGSFPSSVTASTNPQQPQTSTWDYSGSAAGYDTATDTVSVTVDGNTYDLTPAEAATAGITGTGATALNQALDNLASQLQSQYPAYTITTNTAANTLTVAAGSADPVFTDGNANVNATVINPTTTQSYTEVNFAGALSNINNGDVISMTINDTEYSLAYDQGTHFNLEGFLEAFADQIDGGGAGGFVIHPDTTDAAEAADAAAAGVTQTANSLIFVGNPTINQSATVAGGATYARYLANNDETALYQANGSYSGGAVTIYNDLGTPVDVQMRWVNTGVDDQWSLIAKDPNGGTDPWTHLGTFTFVNGSPTQVATTPGGTPTAFAGTLTLPPNTFSGFGEEMTLDFTGIDNDPNDGQPNTLLTQYYADDIAVYRLDQDGYQAGILTDVFINDFGYVVANYDNGRSRTLYQVPLATFASPDELKRMDGGSFKRTPESGDPLIAESGQAGAGNIIASAVEQSNVDIADEFTKMIVTQRAYSANSKTVRTADQMLEEVVNLKR